MKTIKNLLMLSLILAIVGCSNPKEKASSGKLTEKKEKSQRSLHLQLLTSNDVPHHVSSGY